MSREKENGEESQHKTHFESISFDHREMAP